MSGYDFPTGSLPQSISQTLRAQIDAYLSDPLNFPLELKQWLITYLEVNPPQLPPPKISMIDLPPLQAEPANPPTGVGRLYVWDNSGTYTLVANVNGTKTTLATG